MKIKFTLKPKELDKKWLRAVRDFYGKKKITVTIEYADDAEWDWEEDEIWEDDDDDNDWEAFMNEVAEAEVETPETVDNQVAEVVENTESPKRKRRSKAEIEAEKAKKEEAKPAKRKRRTKAEIEAENAAKNEAETAENNKDEA